MAKTIRTTTVISLRWKADNSIEVFVNLGKLFSKYDGEKLGVSRFTLDRKDLKEGYENDVIALRKLEIT
jgi:hypothetical protein